VLHSLICQIGGGSKRINRQLARGIDVFAYFNNDAQGYAVRNATDLKRYLGLGNDLGNKAP